MLAFVVDDRRTRAFVAEVKHLLMCNRWGGFVIVPYNQFERVHRRLFNVHESFVESQKYPEMVEDVQNRENYLA